MLQDKLTPIEIPKDSERAIRKALDNKRNLQLRKKAAYLFNAAGKALREGEREIAGELVGEASKVFSITWGVEPEEDS